MPTNEQILSVFEDHLAKLTAPPEPQRLYEPLIYSMSGGGKRLRPVLLLQACAAYCDDIRPALNAATAVEVFHNFTLLHDDIMDNAMMRRGKPSVHAKWGANVAILSGDAMLICAYKLLRMSPEELLPQLLDIFNKMAAEVCEGQQYDMDFEQRHKVSVVEYMHMIELKTAVLLAGAIHIGALIGGAPEEDCRKLCRFATEIGLAFQLQDDLLDSFGTEAELGKRIGGDILEGKQTYLMVMAYSRADEPAREVLRTTYKDERLTDDEKIERVKGIFTSLGVDHMTEQQITVRFERALGILDTLSIPAERTEPLKEFARNLIGRKK